MFLHGQCQKSKQKPTTKNFVGFHNPFPILTMMPPRIVRAIRNILQNREWPTAYYNNEKMNVFFTFCYIFYFFRTRLVPSSIFWVNCLCKKNLLAKWPGVCYERVSERLHKSDCIYYEQPIKLFLVVKVNLIPIQFRMVIFILRRRYSSIRLTLTLSVG